MEYLGKLIKWLSPFVFGAVFLHELGYTDLGEYENLSLTYLYFYEALHWLIIPFLLLVAILIPFSVDRMDSKQVSKLKEMVNKIEKPMFKLFNAIYISIGILSYVILQDTSLSLCILFTSFVGFIFTQMLKGALEPLDA